MRITVLYGGPSAEREVSLISGQAVAEGLRAMGHEVFAADISPDDLSALDHEADVIFPVLHGAFGENGELQEILEQRKLPFVGSGARASRIGMNKVMTKRLWKAAGLPVAPEVVLNGNGQVHGLECVDFPCVVKPIASGSSLDVHICNSEADARMAIHSIVRKDGTVMVEKYIRGPELTVGLLEEQPLEPIRIIPRSEFFDYEAKYHSTETEHRFDTGLPAEVVDRCRELAAHANQVVGARDLARVDIMLDEAHNPVLLEINTLPGFTPKSLLPEAAAHAGISFGHLVDRLARRACERGQRDFAGALQYSC